MAWRYTPHNQFGMRIDYKQLVRQIIDYFISQADVHLHLVPHVVHSSSHVENDYEVCRKIQNEYDTDRITLAPFFLDPIDAKNYISGLDYFVGARMHACIAAFSSGVPVYPIAYSRKFNGLFAETLEYPYMGDLINESEEQLMSNLKLAFENKEILADKIQYSLEGIVMLKENVLKDELKSIFDETKSKNNR